jgi:type III secretory pathway component EscS
MCTYVCREGDHVTVKVVAIIGVLSASVVFIASLIGTLCLVQAMLCLLSNDGPA